MAAFLHRYQQGGFRTSIPIPSAGPSEWIKAVEATILSRVHAERSAAGAGRLSRSAAMDTVARDWSETMARTGSFTHNPDYSSQVPAGWSAVAENIVWAGGLTGQSAEVAGRRLMANWMDSTGHRNNILNRQYTHIGIGVAVQNGRTYATQVFARY